MVLGLVRGFYAVLGVDKEIGLISGIPAHTFPAINWGLKTKKECVYKVGALTVVHLGM